jgi:hypothetical protein
MGVVDVREMYRGVSRQTQYGEVPVYTRIFIVRTDEFVSQSNGDGRVTIQDIGAAPGIAWLDHHPENDEALLIESNIQQEGDSPFHWKLTFTYKTAVDILQTPWDRPPQFSFSGSLASAPAFWYFPNNNDNNTKQIIINSAGDPIGGLDRDEAEFTVSISLNLKQPGEGDPFFNVVKSQQYVGAINSDTWSGGEPKTWKCQSITANRKIEQVAGTTYVYWEGNTTLAYRNSGWDLQTWDVGFNEIVGGQRRKIMAGSEPVSEPAALSNGRAKAPGQPPDLKTFRIYPMLPFNGTFPQFPTG